MPDPKDDDLDGVPKVADTVRPAAPDDADLYSSQTVVRAVNPTLLAAARDGRLARMAARDAKNEQQPQGGAAASPAASAPAKPTSKALPTLPLPSATLLGALVAPGAQSQPPRPPSRANPVAASTRAALPPPTPPPPKSSPGASAPPRAPVPARAMPIAPAPVAYEGLPSRAGAPPPPPPSAPGSRPPAPMGAAHSPAPLPAAVPAAEPRAMPPQQTVVIAPAVAVGTPHTPASPVEPAPPQLSPADVFGTDPLPQAIAEEPVVVAPRSQPPRVLPAMTARSMQPSLLDKALDLAQQHARPLAIGAAVFVLLLVLVVRAC